MVDHMNEVRPPPAEYAKPPVMRGQDNPKWVSPIVCVCRNCGHTFERKPHRIGPDGRTGDYCSNECRDEYRHKHQRGPDSPFWLGGPDSYRGRNWQRIRRKVVAKQRGRCAHCGTLVGDSLPIHHITPFRDFESATEANRLDNLIGLCQPCHMKTEPRRSS